MFLIISISKRCFFYGRSDNQHIVPHFWRCFAASQLQAICGPNIFQPHTIYGPERFSQIFLQNSAIPSSINFQPHTMGRRYIVDAQLNLFAFSFPATCHQTNTKGKAGQSSGPEKSCQMFFLQFSVLNFNC